MNPRFWRWVVPSLGLVLGLALGLVYSWVINPVQLINTYPGLLRSDYRHDWIRLAALSYVADDDLGKAQARLASIESDDIIPALETLIEDFAVVGHTAETMRKLTTLAESLGANTPAMFVYAPTARDTPTTQPTVASTQSATPTPMPTTTPSPSPMPTNTPPTPTQKPQVTATSEITYQPVIPSPSLTISPTNTPSLPTATPTPILTFQMVEKEQICDFATSPPHIEVLVQDEDEEPLDGIQIWLIWDDGADRAITGLKPDLGSGYADFQMDSDLTYGLGVGELGQLLVTRLRPEPCPDQDADTPPIGSWRIVFQLGLVQTE